MRLFCVFALPDSGVTVWRVRLILDPPAFPHSPHPHFNRKTAITNREPVNDGERRQPAVNPIAGGSSEGGFPDSTCHPAAGL